MTSPPATWRYGSVCSGIEAASVAWRPLGLAPAWFAEIDRFACALLAHHYPRVPNHGDLLQLPLRMLAGELEAPDILVGGTPCQAFSLAGLRQGLADPRGALTLSYVELADAIDHIRAYERRPPAVFVWENVPGVLSDRGNAFGCLLAALAGESTALCPSRPRWAHAGVVLGPPEQSRGGCSMPNISAWPNDASVCSLSQVLEQGSIPPKYCLSAKACAGILRRSARHNKRLPAPLRHAMLAVIWAACSR